MELKRALLLVFFVYTIIRNMNGSDKNKVNALQAVRERFLMRVDKHKEEFRKKMQALFKKIDDRKLDEIRKNLKQ